MQRGVAVEVHLVDGLLGLLLNQLLEPRAPWLLSRYLDNIYIISTLSTPGEVPRLHRGKQLGLHGDGEQTDRQQGHRHQHGTGQRDFYTGGCIKRTQKSIIYQDIQT